MKPEIKTRWVAALRSGQYTQGQKALSVDDTYCCLGVLCELAVADGAVESITETTPDGVSRFKMYGLYRSKSFLPREVRYWAGMRDEIGELDEPVATPKGQADALTMANDNGLTFDQIADIIEEQF